MPEEDRLFHEVLADFDQANSRVRTLTDLAYSEHYEFHADESIKFCNHSTCRLVVRVLSA